MTINTKFSIGQKVRIGELDRTGTVTEIFVNEFGTQYRVRYFDNASPQTVTFFERELAADPQTV